MTRARFGSWTLGVAILLLFVSRSMSAIGPAAILVHGGELETPVVVRPAIGSFVFMWGFWGRFEPEELKSEAASQHGRLYLPTAVEPAAIVLTPPTMNNPEPGATRAKATPIPSHFKDFAFGRGLTPSETATLVAAGVPMN